MNDKEKDVGDQEMIREQRGNGKRSEESASEGPASPARASSEMSGAAPRSEAKPSRRREEQEQRGNGEPRPAPTAGGVTRKQD